MSAETPQKAELLQAPAQPVWALACKRGLLGLLIGLGIALAIVVLDQRKANSVNKVFVEARTILLQYQGEQGVWPKDCALAAPGDQFGGFKLDALLGALARCELPGKWTFVANPADGRPAIVFTPAEPGRAYRRVLAVVDRWLDDGDAASGDLRVGEDAARLRL